LLFVRAVVSPAGVGLTLAASVAFATGSLWNHYKKPASLDLRVLRYHAAYVVDEVPDAPTPSARPLTSLAPYNNIHTS
jgi:hypothetical protein